MRPSKPVVATFYSGVGGCDWGLEQAGFDVSFGVEYDPEIAEFYRLNHPNSTLFNCKVEDKDFSEFKGKIWGVHGSPPCQSFSYLRNPKLSARSDKEESFNFVKAISQIMPIYVTLENVYAYKQSEVFGSVCDIMGSLGYYAIFSDISCDHEIFNYSNFGGPQRRKRLIARWVHESYIDNISYKLKGSNLLGNKYLYAPEFKPDYFRSVSWFDIIKPHLVNLKNWHLKDLVKECIDFQWFAPNSYYIFDSKENRVLSDKIVYKSVKDFMPTICTYAQFVIFKTPSHIVNKNQFFDETKCWRVTANYLKLLQGFPDNCTLSNKETLAKRMIGNAVPPAMIAGIWSKFQ